MQRQHALALLAAYRVEFRDLGVAALALFGSVARDERHEHGDVDILVEFDRPVSLFQFFRLQHRLEDILGVPKVDLVQRSAIHPAIRERILSEAVYVP